MSAPVTKEIPLNQLKAWLNHLEKGINPDVTFNHDNVKMLEAAYKVRGDMLQSVKNQIHGYIGIYE